MKFARLFGFILLAQLVGGSSAVVTARAIRDGWYDALDKPKWTPLNRVFAPVWTTLFALMAVAAWRVWERRDDHPRETRTALTWWGVQLALNALWSLLFFGARKPKWALLEIAALWTSILVTTRAFSKRDFLAGALLWPYLAWTTFAALLNIGIARRNTD